MDADFFKVIIAVAVGALIPLLGNYFSQKREIRLKLLEKLIDKRIIAHEELFGLVLAIRQVVSTDKVDKERNVIGYPACLETEDTFIEFWQHAFLLIHKNSPWINKSLARELSYFQDYVMTLRLNVFFNSPAELVYVREFIKQDFIDFSATLEREIHEFLDGDILKLRGKAERGWHKYPKNVTIERLNATLLMKFVESKKI